MNNKIEAPQINNQNNEVSSTIEEELSFEDDPIQLKEAWQTLVKIGPEGRSQMGVNARKRIEKHFALSTSVERYQNLYKNFFRLSKNN